jgi:hypothetical protein
MFGNGANPVITAQAEKMARATACRFRQDSRLCFYRIPPPILKSENEVSHA